MKHRTGHLFKRGDNYYLRWAVEGKVFCKALRDSDGNPVTTKEHAEIEQEKVMVPFKLGDQVAALESIAGRLAGRKAELARFEEEKNPSIALSRVWADYLASPKRPDSGEATLRQYESQWAAFKTWMEAKKPEATMADVTAEIAEEYAGTLNHGRFSGGTINKHLNLLTLVFRVLKTKGRIEVNPWADIQRKKIVQNTRRELTIDELKKLCQSAAGELRTLLALGCYSGMRLGDCATLRWAETDLSRGIIRRIPNKTARKKPVPVIIPIHQVLLAMLSEIPVDKRYEFVLPEMAALYEKRNDLVSTVVQKHFAACGIRLHKRGTGADANSKDGKNKRAVLEVGFHSLRHTFVSLCRASNAPLAVVEAIVGHSNPAMTRHYTHVGELAATQAVGLLPSITGDEPKQEPKRDPEAILAKARGIVEAMKAKSWKQDKAALLTLLAAPVPV